MSKILSVADAISLNPETWLNDGITGTVKEIKTIPKKAGGNFFKVTLADNQHPSAAIAFSAFMAPKYNQGDTLEITGKGIMRGEYNGAPELKVGKDADIRVCGASPAAVLAAAHGTPQTGTNSSAGQGTPIHGATAGGGIARSVEVLLATNPDVFKGNRETWKKAVYALALGFTEISDALEHGKDLDVNPF